MQLISLKSHTQRVHNKENPYKCAECERSFGDAKGLSTHNQKVHRFASLFVCDLCCATFKGKTALTAHMKSHGKIIKILNLKL